MTTEMKKDVDERRFFNARNSSTQVLEQKCEMRKEICVLLVLIEISALAYSSLKKKSSKMCLYSKKNVLIFEEKCATI